MTCVRKKDIFFAELKAIGEIHIRLPSHLTGFEDLYVICQFAVFIAQNVLILIQAEVSKQSEATEQIRINESDVTKQRENLST